MCRCVYGSACVCINAMNCVCVQYFEETKSKKTIADQ